MQTIKKYLRFIQPYWKRLSLTFAVGILKFGIPLLLPLILKYVVDDILLVSIPLEEKLTNLAWIMVGAFFIFVILRYPIEYYRQFLAQSTASYVLYDLRNRLFDHLQRLSLRYYHNQKVGQIISRMINDVEQTKEFVVTGLSNVWLDMVTLSIAVAIMVWLDPWMTLVSFAIFPLYGISVKYFFKKLKDHTKERSQALGELQGHLHERIQGISVVRAFHLEKHEEKQFENQNRHYLDKAINQSRWTARTFAVVNTVTDIAPLLVISFAAYQVVQGHLTIGEMTAFYGYLSLVYAPIRRLVNASTLLTQSLASMDRVFELFDQPYDIIDDPAAKEMKEIRGEIQFQQVHFRYQAEQDWILRDLNLTIPAGKTVALVGASGGGKSSIISLIPRFFDVNEGRVLIDGIDVRDVTQQSLRRQIGLVLQENILFSGSIEENIRLGKTDATDDEIVEAAKAAHAHEFIKELQDGYQTEIGERGLKLSGGQKQRIALARLFLKNPKILILDEATSALDLQSERLVQDSLERLSQSRTTIIVAHRLSTITHADQIYLIHRGEVLEQGTHEELMAQQGEYAKLFSVQNIGNNAPTPVRLP